MDRTACTEPQCLHKGALYLFYNGYELPYVILPSALYMYSLVVTRTTEQKYSAELMPSW